MIELAVAIALGIILAPLILYAVAVLLVGAVYVVLVPFGFLGLPFVAFKPARRLPPPTELLPFDSQGTLPGTPERAALRKLQDMNRVPQLPLVDSAEQRRLL